MNQIIRRNIKLEFCVDSSSSSDDSTQKVKGKFDKTTPRNPYVAEFINSNRAGNSSNEKKMEEQKLSSANETEDKGILPMEVIKSMTDSVFMSSEWSSSSQYSEYEIKSPEMLHGIEVNALDSSSSRMSGYHERRSS